MEKVAAHADDRMRERTQLSPEVLTRLRRALRKTYLSPGLHHHRFSDGSTAVLKPIGTPRTPAGLRRHVVATVLARTMRPPGTDVTHVLDKVACPVGWAGLVRQAFGITG